MSVSAPPVTTQEAVQEVFVRAWRACGRFSPTGEPVRHWLLVILRHIVIDLVRARARRPRLMAVEVSPRHPDLDDPIGALVLRAHLVDALGCISVEHRSAVLTTVVRDRQYSEAAAELGVPVGTVKSRVFYGLRQLRELLDLPAAV